MKRGQKGQTYLLTVGALFTELQAVVLRLDLRSSNLTYLHPLFYELPAHFIHNTGDTTSVSTSVLFLSIDWMVYPKLVKNGFSDNDFL